MSTPIETRIYERAEIKIDILFPMATTKLTQVFINPGNEIIEAIYQFPIPSEAVLGDVQVKVNHETFTGKIESAYEAESEYEAGVQEGKRSVLVKKLGDGLMEVNAGNLAPEDQISITLTIHTLLERENSSARYHLPTCIAPRYGRYTLDDFSTPYSNILAEYPFTGDVTIIGDETIEITDSTHTLTRTANGARFKGELNQDLSLQLRLSNATSIAYQATLNNKHYALASFKPISVTSPEKPANLQLVVDCSGSMGGRSIAQMREGLRTAIEVFNKEDLINLIRFGSHHETLHSKPVHLSDVCRRQLFEAFDALEANFGGTEIIAALECAVSQIDAPEGGDILLLTDGQVWNEEQQLRQLIDQANARGIRVFCIGVGDNIDDSFLSTLANGTGGQLRRANPHENMARVVASSVTQIRRASLPCSEEPDAAIIWQSPLSSCLANEHPTYMRVSEKPQTICSLAVGESELQAATQELPKHAYPFERALIQLVANEQMRLADETEALTIALEAEIISEYTSYVMVSDQVVEGASGLPEVAHLPQSAPRSLMDSADLPRFRMGSYDRSERLMSSEKSAPYYETEILDEACMSRSNESVRQPVSLEQLIAYLHIDLTLLEKMLDRRKHKDQNIDFNLLSICGIDGYRLSQLQEAYCDLLDDDAEVTEEQFVSAVIQRFVAEQGCTLKPAVTARLDKMIGVFEI